MKWFKKRSGHVVDAVEQIEASQGRLEDDDARPKLDTAARPLAPGAKGFMMVLGFMAMALLVLFAFRFGRGGESTNAAASSTSAKIENLLPALKLGQPPTRQPDPAPDPKPETPLATAPTLPDLGLKTSAPAAQTLLGLDPLEQRRLQPGLRAEQTDQSGSSSGERPASASAQPDSGPMADRLRPMRLSAAHAGFMGNRDLQLTQGAMIDCVQQTRFITAQAGMITCYATREVRSASGRVVLIDAGTIFTGYQQSVLAHGQPRVGVVWSRLETPNGVIVNLDSPATGPLGEAGLDGEIDTHFAARFGAALMISLIDDAGTYLANRGRSGGSDNGRWDGTQSAAKDAISTVLDSTMNIPPTLYRNQGSRVGIYVARDLDFSSVYELRPRDALALNAPARATTSP